jgi:hypothetical protein
MNDQAELFDTFPEGNAAMMPWRRKLVRRAGERSAAVGLLPMPLGWMAAAWRALLAHA